MYQNASAQSSVTGM